MKNLPALLTPITPPNNFPERPPWRLRFSLPALVFSLPILLFPETHPLNGPISSEILNLNFLVAWMGLAHFVFAYYGQGKYLRQNERRGTLLFFSGPIASASVLLLLKEVSDSRIFDFVIWIYFIPHFIKAELHFAHADGKPSQKGWVLYWFPALAFAFLTFSLFGPKELAFYTSILIGLAILCVVAGALGGIGRQLYSANAKYTLLAFFFIGEALVWGTYSALVLAQHLHHAAVGREMIVVRKRLRHPGAVRHFERVLPAVRIVFVGAEQAEVFALHVQLHHVAQELAHRARGLGVGGAGLLHFDGVFAEVGHSQIAQEQAAVAVRIGAHAAFALGREFGQLRFEAAIRVEEFLRLVALHPLLRGF